MLYQAAVCFVESQDNVFMRLLCSKVFYVLFSSLTDSVNWTTKFCSINKLFLDYGCVFFMLLQKGKCEMLFGLISECL